MRTVPALLFAAAVLAAVPPPAAAQSRPVDCIAAVVAGEAVSRFDVEAAEAVGLFGPVGASDPAARRLAVLDRFIDQKLILDQVRSAPAADAAAVDTEWRRLSARIGPEALAARLGRLGLAEIDLRPYVEERVRCRRVLDERFGRTVSVSLREIEAYYADVYAPARRAESRVAEPLVDVLDAIEAEIKKAKIEAQAAAWIDGLREQGEVEVRRDCLR